MPTKIGPEIVTRETDGAFFEGVIAPAMNQLAREAKAEVAFRLDQIRAVPTAAERAAVRNLQQRIVSGLDEVSQGADAEKLCEQLVAVVSERDGPTPFLGRVLAVQTIGRLLADGEIALAPDQPLGEELIKAMATEPVMRGGPILEGVLEGSVRGQQQETSSRPPRWKVPWDPDINDKEQRDQWKRQAMIAEVADRFAENPNLAMTLPEWRVVMGVMSLEPGSHPAGHMVPKYVVRLKALRRGVHHKGDESLPDELRCHICSPEMQLVAAAYGMPRSDRFEAADMVTRNPTAVLTGSRLALDETKGEQALRLQGLGVDALYVMDDDQKGRLEEEMERLRGSLPFKFAQDLLPPDGLTWVVAARALRRVRHLSQSTQRRRIGGAVESVIRQLTAPAEIQVFEKGQLVSSNQTSIMAAYTGQFNRERGVLEGRTVTEAEATDSLRTAAIGLLSTVTPDGIPVVRAQRDIVRLMPEVVKKGIAPEDLKSFSSLGKSHDVRIETIHRENTPRGARPPITVVKG